MKTMREGERTGDTFNTQGESLFVSAHEDTNPECEKPIAEINDHGTEVNNLILNSILSLNIQNKVSHNVLVA